MTIVILFNSVALLLIGLLNLHVLSVLDEHEKAIRLMADKYADYIIRIMNILNQELKINQEIIKKWGDTDE